MIFKLSSCYIYAVVHIIAVCNMGRSDLPDMYTQAQGNAVAKGKCGHIR